jgi:hypothetical protein
VNFFDFPFWQSFVSNASATFLGAIVGILGALWLNNYWEKRKKNETKKKMLDVLLSEIKENINTLDIWENTEKDINKLSSFREPLISLYTNLYTESWDGFSNGGDLQWIDDPLTLNILATNYHRVYDIKFLSKICIDFAFSKSQIFDLQPFEIAGKRLGEKIHTALTTLDDIQKHVEVVLKKMGN